MLIPIASPRLQVSHLLVIVLLPLTTPLSNYLQILANQLLAHP